MAHSWAPVEALYATVAKSRRLVDGLWPVTNTLDPSGLAARALKPVPDALGVAHDWVPVEALYAIVELLPVTNTLDPSGLTPRPVALLAAAVARATHS
jgi:hypothetical protein